MECALTHQIVQRIKAPVTQKKKAWTVSKAIVQQSGKKATGRRRGRGFRTPVGQKRLTKFVVAFIACSSLLGQATHHNSGKAHWNLGTHDVWRRGRGVQHFGDEFDEVSSLKWSLPGQQVVQGGTGGIDVRSGIERPAAELFWRSISGRANHGTGGREQGFFSREGRNRQTKISNR